MVGLVGLDLGARSLAADGAGSDGGSDGPTGWATPTGREGGRGAAAFWLVRLALVLDAWAARRSPAESRTAESVCGDDAEAGVGPRSRQRRRSEERSIVPDPDHQLGSAGPSWSWPEIALASWLRRLPG